MTSSKNVLLDNFRKKQANKETAFSQEALRLVNLYRSLDCFASEFVDKYNQMLLGASPSVRRLLGTFVGGEEVEDYLEFLQQNAHLSDVEVEQKTDMDIKSKGYLPEPNSDISSSQNNVQFSQDEFEKLKAEQKLLKEQIQKLLNQLGQTSQQPKPNFKNSFVSSPSSDTYSEIVEEMQEEKTHE